MHARIDQLLTLRDGERVDARIVAHVGRCSHCAAELERLRVLRRRMKELPQLEGPSWEQMHGRLQRAPGARRNARILAIAVAASVAALAIVVSLLAIGARMPQRDEGTNVVRLAEHAAPQPVTNNVAELVTQSRELEEMLRVLPARPAVERVTTAATIDTIEQRIQWLDFHLSYAPDAGLNEQQAQRLWRERVELMDSLVKVRYAESGYFAF